MVFELEVAEELNQGPKAFHDTLRCYLIFSETLLIEHKTIIIKWCCLIGGVRQTFGFLGFVLLVCMHYNHQGSEEPSFREVCVLHSYTTLS